MKATMKALHQGARHQAGVQSARRAVVVPDQECRP